MAKVMIDQISFENFRQYGTQTISFSHGKNHELFVIIARNGTGKTTFLNAITWCLYGEEKLTTEDQEDTLPLINSAVLSSSQPEDIVPVSVKMRIIDNSQYIIFDRRQEFKLVVGNEGILKTVPNISKLSVQITQLGTSKNTQIVEGNDAALIVKQYFDLPIYNFYFFDGENLKTYFEKEKSEQIKNAIYNISQVTLLENTINHVHTLSQELTREISKNVPNANILIEKQAKLVEEKTTAELFLNSNIEELSRTKEELQRIEARQKQITPIQEQLRRRDELIEDEKSLEERIEKNKEDLSAFISRYTVLLNVYPRAKRVLEVIHNKQNAGDLPPVIDKHLLELLLKDPDAKCPICENNVNETAREHLQKLYEKMSVSASTSAFLLEIKGSLETIVEEAENYEEEKIRLLDERDKLHIKYEEVEKKLSDVSRTLSSYDQHLKNDDKDLEERRINVIGKIEEINRNIGGAKTTIANKEDEIEGLQKSINEATSKKDKYHRITMQRDVFLKLEERFTTIKNNITSGMRKEIERNTLNTFLNMSPKQNTFGSITVDDSYFIKVRDVNGRSMRASLSATETMALAYAFTLAIHTASGKNCPLVIDSPLGRVSDFNREKMARVLFDTSLNKQIIMLFTPDEYSDNVQRIYKNKVNEIRLHLSADEKTVEKGN